MLPVLCLLFLVAALRLWLLLRQRAVLRTQEQPYALGLVSQRVGQQLWQQGWPLILIAALPWLSGADPLTLLLLVVAGGLWEWPAKAVKPFGLDARHGINRMTFAAFAREQAIQLALLAVLALPAAWLALQLLTGTDKRAWLLIWAIGWGGWAALRALQPAFAARLFDRLEPLPAGALRTRLEALLHRSGARVQRLFVQASSARSTQANAQVSGSARAPRIVLGDTLMAMLQADEVEAVVAHELGHLQRGHLRFQRLMIAAASFLMVMVAAALTAGIAEPVARLAIAWALLPSLWFFALPLTNYWYRRFEFEADDSAARQASGAALARALRQLTRNNRNAPVADRWYERVYHTHPATAERLARLDRAGT